MASASSSVIQERRLRPISELLNNGNNKKVITEVDRLLRKTPDYLPAKICKALALIRMDKLAEARCILEELKNMQVNQDLADLLVGDTAHNLLRCYKEMNEPETICSILEVLCSKTPREELYIQYFMALVRIDDYGKMNKIALHMYKTFRKPIYFYWSVASLILQQDNVMGPLDFAAQLSLQLAERMIDKYLLDEMDNEVNPSNHPILLDLYARMLWRQSTNWMKLLTILSAQEYPPEDLSTWVWDDNHEIYCTAMHRSERKDELLEYLRKLFFQHKDFALLKQIVDLFGDCDKGKEFMEYVRDTHPGFAVAMGNIYYAQQQNKEICTPKEILDRDLEMMVQYGLDKINFFPDSIDHIRQVNKDTQEKLLKLMASTLKVKEEDFNENTAREDMIKDINYELAQRELMATQWGIVQRVNQANRCFGKYLRLKGKREKIVPVEDSAEDKDNKSETEEEKELNFVDQYVLIAATILMSENFKLEEKDQLSQTFDESLTLAKNDKEEETKKVHGEELVVTAICVMEYCLEWHPQNSTLRLILANAYARLGAIREMLKILDEADIKHIQYDTMGYLLFPLVLSSGLYAEGLNILRQADTMYRSFQTDAMEYVIAAYEHCNFKQASNFRPFTDRLLQSMQFGLVLVELGLLSYVVCVNNVEQIKSYAAVVERDLNLEGMSTLRGFDNRDLTLIQNLFDNPTDWEKFTTTTASMDQHWYKTRLCLLVALTKLINLVPPENADPDSMHNGLEEVEEIFLMWEQCSTEWERVELDKKLETPYVGVYPPLYTRHFQLSCHKFMYEQCKLVTNLVQEKDYQATMNKMECIQKCIQGQSKELLSVLENNLASFQNDPTFKLIERCMHDFHWILEHFSFTKIVLFVAVNKAKNVLSEETKNRGKGRRGRTAVNTPLLVEATIAAFDKLKMLFVQFSEYFEKLSLPTWPDPTIHIEAVVKNTSVEVGFLMESFSTAYDRVQKNLRESHKFQLDGMRVLAELLLHFIKDLGK